MITRDDKERVGRGFYGELLASVEVVGRVEAGHPRGAPQVPRFARDDKERMARVLW
jgi:hypothetical protein